MKAHLGMCVEAPAEAAYCLPAVDGGMHHGGRSVGSAVAIVSVDKYAGEYAVRLDDVVPLEEPLEIRLSFGKGGVVRTVRNLAVTMRTPGHDAELAVGFLVTEGLVKDEADIECVQVIATNVVQVDFAVGVIPELSGLQRNFHTTSSCGVCGKVSLAAVNIIASRPLVHGKPLLPAALIPLLPERLREAQAIFNSTGGIHAAGLFDRVGNLLCVREDVGRHNAVDKVIGAALRAGWLPANDHILVVSGRASFELMQKAVLAGIPVLASVGAPSSLAVRLAEESGATLLGFVRPGRFNVYAGGERIRR